MNGLPDSQFHKGKSNQGGCLWRRNTFLYSGFSYRCKQTPEADAQGGREADTSTATEVIVGWGDTDTLILKEQFFDAPPQKKIGGGARIFFIFRKSQLDHNSNLYLKQL